MMWVLIAIVVILAAAYVWYAMIVTRRNRVSEALAGIDVQLQQRHDLIPNVLTIARRFMEHERTLLEEITELRNKAQAQVGSRDFAAAEQRFETEKRLGVDMGRLFALAENYPDLQSQGPMWRRNGPTLRSKRTFPPPGVSTTAPWATFETSWRFFRALS